MNLMDISTQMLYTTVPIYTMRNDGKQSTGTGFIFSILHNNDSTKSIPFLITNHHVIEDLREGFCEFSLMEDDIPVKEKSIKIAFDKSIILNKLGNLDLVAIPIGQTLNELNDRGIKVFFKSIMVDMIPEKEVIEELAALEDITFIGYPSGLFDTHNKTPIIRRGITATPIWNDFEGQRSFLIDAGVFPGSSGSPVFIFNQGGYSSKNALVVGSRILFVGIISDTIRKTDGAYLGLGKVIKSNAMVEELKKLIGDFN